MNIPPIQGSLNPGSLEPGHVHIHMARVKNTIFENSPYHDND
jgi:hypothetical protein